MAIKVMRGGLNKPRGLVGGPSEEEEEVAGVRDPTRREAARRRSCRRRPPIDKQLRETTSDRNPRTPPPYRSHSTTNDSLRAFSVGPI